MARCCLLLCVILFFSCRHRWKNEQVLFSQYKEDTTGFFSLDRKSVIKHSTGQYESFSLKLVDEWKTITGYLGVESNYLYYLNILRENACPLINFDNKELASEDCIVSYMLANRTGNNQSEVSWHTDTIKPKQWKSIITSNDTIHRVLLDKFRVLRNDDNLVLYIQKEKGIVGAASFLSDSTVLYYRGRVYSDTNLTLERKRLILQ